MQIILSKDEDWRVRDAIASKYPIDRSLYEMLSKDKNSIVRGTIAYNKKTPLDILKRIISEDKEEHIRKNAKENYERRINKN